MVDRYRTHEGVVVGRRILPSGDVVLRFLTGEGPLEGVARGAQRPGGRSGRLSLFFRLRFQTYRRPGAELLTVTQVTFIEAYPLTQPRRFAAASFLSELGWRTLSPEVAAKGYPIFLSGLKGVAGAGDVRVPLVWAGFRLLKLAGYGPQGAGNYLSLDGSLGPEPGQGAVFLGEDGGAALYAVLNRSGKAAVSQLEKAPLDRLTEALIRYSEAQLGPFRTQGALRGFL